MKLKQKILIGIIVLIILSGIIIIVDDNCQYNDCIDGYRYDEAFTVEGVYPNNVIGSKVLLTKKNTYEIVDSTRIISSVNQIATSELARNEINNDFKFEKSIPTSLDWHIILLDGRHIDITQILTNQIEQPTMSGKVKICQITSYKINGKILENNEMKLTFRF